MAFVHFLPCAWIIRYEKYLTGKWWTIIDGSKGFSLFVCLWKILFEKRAFDDVVIDEV